MGNSERYIYTHFVPRKIDMLFQAQQSINKKFFYCTFLVRKTYVSPVLAAL